MAEDDDPFESPRLLLDGARRHIAAFEATMQTLRATDGAYSVATPKEGSDGTATIRVGAPIPPELKQIAFDIAHNLRSALDQAVFGSTRALTGKELDGTKFPFGDDAKGARDNAKGRCKHVPPEMVEFLLAFETHADGNRLLWGLNKLRNTKSHRILVPVVGTVTMNPDTPVTGAGELSLVDWNPATGTLKVQLQPSPDGTLTAVALAFRLEVLIGTGEFRGEPALRVFDGLLGEVERIVSGIEAETARLLRERAG